MMRYCIYPTLVLLHIIFAGSGCLADDLSDRFRSIQQNLQKQREEFLGKLQTAATSRERDDIAKEAPDPEPFAKQALALVQENPASSDALTILIWVISNSPMKQGRQSSTTQTAMQAIQERHLRDPQLGPLIATLTWSIDVANESLLARIIQENASVEIQGTAMYALAGLWMQQAEAIELFRWRLRIANASERASIDTSLHDDYGDATAAHMRTVSPNELLSKANQLLRSLLDQDDHHATRTSFSKVHSLHELAKMRLFSLEHLQVGQMAPTIRGESLDGEAISTDRMKGKQLLVIFTGQWCVACRSLYPITRELAESNASDLQIISISSDSTFAESQSTAKEEKLSWPILWDGSPNGPIATEWQIDGWPFVVLIDETGVIRHRFRGAPTRDMLRSALQDAREPTR